MFPIIFVVRKLRPVLLLCLLTLIPAASVFAQAAPPPPPPEKGADYTNRWDFFGGASYAHFNGIGNVAATNLEGFNLQATAWIKPVFGFAGTVRGNYGTYPIGTNVYGASSPFISQHIFMVGPEFRLWKTPRHALNFHVMGGGVYGKFSSGLNGAPPNALGLYVDQLAFAAAVGGSFDFNLSPRLSVRLMSDFAPTRFGSGTQEEFAGAVGIVYKMGSLKGGK